MEEFQDGSDFCETSLIKSFFNPTWIEKSKLTETVHSTSTTENWAVDFLWTFQTKTLITVLTEFAFVTPNLTTTGSSTTNRIFVTSSTNTGAITTIFAKSAFSTNNWPLRTTFTRC
jgi:hypothetical protein